MALVKLVLIFGSYIWVEMPRILQALGTYVIVCSGVFLDGCLGTRTANDITPCWRGAVGSMLDTIRE